MFDTSTGKVGAFKGYDVQVVSLSPNDIILLHVSEDMGYQECIQIQEEMQKEFPNNKVIVVNELVLKKISIIKNNNPFDPIGEIQYDYLH